jgi:hypothetical protein
MYMRGSHPTCSGAGIASLRAACLNMSVSGFTPNSRFLFSPQYLSRSKKLEAHYFILMATSIDYAAKMSAQTDQDSILLFPDCHIHSSHIRAQLEKSLAGTELMSRDPTIHPRWNKIGRTGIFQGSTTSLLISHLTSHGVSIKPRSRVLRSRNFPSRTSRCGLVQR